MASPCALVCLPLLVMLLSGCWMDFRADLGERCRGDHDPECKDGLVCNYAYAPRMICTEPGDIGDVCGRDDNCRDGLRCFGTNDDGEATCQPGLEAGEPCRIDRCLEGLHCNYGYDPPICTDRPEAGDVCAHDTWCPDGLVCNAGFERPICVERSKAGEPCAKPSDCVDGHTCRLDADGCTRSCVPRVGAGHACEVDGDCQEGLLCLKDGGVCSALLDLGEDCARDDECRLGLCFGVDGAQPRCTLALDAGQRCDAASQCRGALTCNHALDPPVCVGRGGAGEPCAWHSDCGVGFFCTGEDQPTCQRERGDGTLCIAGNYCSEGLYCIHEPDQFVGRCRTAAAGPGEACVSDFDCQGDLICMREQCVEPTPLGEPCEQVDECEKAIGECPDDAPRGCIDPLVVCNLATLRCEYQNDIGGPCVWNFDCRGDLRCDTTLDAPECVQPPPEPGGECASDHDCAGALICSSGRCVQAPTSCE